MANSPRYDRIRQVANDGLQKTLDEASKDESKPASFRFSYLGAVSKMVSIVVKELLREIEDLEQRVQERGFPYRGVWQKAEQYNRGDFVTHDGSMWHCNASTRERPGAGDDWQLAVKAGRDGKDGGR